MMRRAIRVPIPPPPLLLLLFLLIPMLPGCDLLSVGDEAEYPSFPWPVAEPASQGVDPALLNEAAEEAHRMAYVRSLLLVRHGSLVGEYYFGSGRIDRPWPLRSVTKSVISALVGIALRQGKLPGINVPILDYYPEYAGAAADPRMAQVTLRHLLTMTGGIPADGQDIEAAAAQDPIGATLTRPLAADPGTTFLYSSLGVHLLSGMLGRIYHRSTSATAWLELCEPLGISIPRWDTDLQGNPYGGSGAHMTPRDMARFGWLYLEGGEVGGLRILDESWIEASLDTQVGLNGSDELAGNLGYGYLWWIDTMGNYRVHYACGFAGQFILLVPGLDLIVVTTADIDGDPEARGAQSEPILQFIRDRVLPAVIPEATPPIR
jgi:CubicO group peptidase (beta-lactamase class C family)